MGRLDAENPPHTASRKWAARTRAMYSVPGSSPSSVWRCCAPGMEAEAVFHGADSEFSANCSWKAVAVGTGDHATVRDVGDDASEVGGGQLGKSILKMLRAAEQVESEGPISDEPAAGFTTMVATRSQKAGSEPPSKGGASASVAHCKTQARQQQGGGSGSAPGAEKEAPAQHGHIEPNAIGVFSSIMTYFGYAVLIFFGHLRDFFGNMTRSSRYLGAVPRKGYAPLLKGFETFYNRRLYHRIQDCWNRPVSSSPGAHIDVVDRVTNDGNKTMVASPAGTVTKCLNLGSYNYLGFADDWQTSCKGPVMEGLEEYNISCASPAAEVGTTAVHRELERTTASFVGKPAAILFNMGYGTNASAIPSLVGAGSLIISDSLNHTSIVAGSRASGAKVAVFRHNDVAHLESVLRKAIVDGQPKTGRAWRKVVVMVEGIYSMEGEICNLKGVVATAKKYGAYMYVDEAHSIGALGATGRGVCEYCGVDPRDVDIMMGTFTKSFGAMGGYIAGSEECIAYLRGASSGSLYANSMSPTVCRQILTALNVISGADGTGLGQRKLRAIKDNSNFFRQGLLDMGLEVLGDWDSPIMPIMLYNPAKISAFSRECLARNLAVVVVGFPATPLVLSRARFCISAGHSRADLADALKKIDEVATLIKIKYAKSSTG